MSISAKLKVLRRQQRYSQARLAELVGVSQNLISRWETGKAIPRSDELARVARVLKVDPAHFADEATDAERLSDLSKDERQVVDLMREVGLTAKDVLGRLLARPAPVFPRGPDGKIVVRDWEETQNQKSDVPATQVADAAEIARQARRKKPV